MDERELGVLGKALQTLHEGFEHLPRNHTDTDDAALAVVLDEVAGRLHDNYPYQHPLYAGQMLKPPHPVARLAYTLAMHLNPNNHALDGGRASSAMEKEAVASLAAMFGWQTHLGHLTSGGTVANLEALWVAGQLYPEGKIAASTQAHYTHERISSVLGLPFVAIDSDEQGRLSIPRLTAALANGEISTVVVTLGTTGLGAVDSLAQVLTLRRSYDFRIHVDAAYGGYFVLGDLAPSTQEHFAVLNQVDSIVIDPHKHGLQPYGCGCILFRDPEVGHIYHHDSPYTYFTSDELHLGEISLECSRAGASAVALWATQQLLPMKREGRFASDLNQCLTAARQWYERLAADRGSMTLNSFPELDVVVWAPRARSLSAISALSNAVFRHAAEQDLHIALLRLPAPLAMAQWPEVIEDAADVVCLRVCLMKPEHLQWLDELWSRYASALKKAYG